MLRYQSQGEPEPRLRPPAPADPTTVLAEGVAVAGAAGAAVRLLRAVLAGQAPGPRLPAPRPGQEPGPPQASRASWPPRSRTSRAVSTGSRTAPRTRPAAQCPWWRRWPPQRRTDCRGPSTRSTGRGRPQLAAQLGSRPPENPSVFRRVKKRPPAGGRAAASTPGQSLVFSITGAATPEPQSFGGSWSASRRATRCRIVVRVFRSSSVASCAPIRLLNGWATKLIRRIAPYPASVQASSLARRCAGLGHTPPDGVQREARRRVAPLAASFPSGGPISATVR